MVVYTITLSPGKLKLETFRGQPGHHSKTTLKKKKKITETKKGEGKGKEVWHKTNFGPKYGSEKPKGWPLSI